MPALSRDAEAARRRLLCVLFVWLDQVSADVTPPEPFTVQVLSTPGVFGGDYYAVFSTTDKQSGIDHYEVLENGIWKRVTDPYKLADQSLKTPVEIKAIDKAGNERIAFSNASSTNVRAEQHVDLMTLLLPAGILLLLVLLQWLWQRGRQNEEEMPRP